MSRPGMFTFMPAGNCTIRVARGPKNSSKKHVCPGRTSQPNGATAPAAEAGSTLQIVNAARARRIECFIGDPSWSRQLRDTTANVSGSDCNRGPLAASTRSGRRLIEAICDELTPRQTAARGAIRDPVAAAEPRIVEIGAGPIDAHALAVRELIHIREPGLLRIGCVEGVVDLETDERGPRRLQHDAAK